MKSIIFTAAPNKSSFTHLLSNAYKDWVLSINNDVEIINLYDPEYKLDFLEFEDKREIPENDIIKIIQAKINSSGEIIFIFPIWWGWVPAIMKNFIDSVFISWFAFEYAKEWKKELLSNKKWKIIATCDAPSNIYWENSDWTGINLKTYFEKSVFGFCWIKPAWFKIIWELRTKNIDDRNKILDEVKDMV